MDQVKRARDFMERHPCVKITTPKQNATGEYIAAWSVPARKPGADPVIGQASHRDLEVLLDYLTARFDRGDLMDIETEILR